MSKVYRCFQQFIPSQIIHSRQLLAAGSRNSVPEWDERDAESEIPAFAFSGCGKTPIGRCWYGYCYPAGTGQVRPILRELRQNPAERFAKDFRPEPDFHFP